MAQTNTIDRYFSKLNQSDAGARKHGVTTTKQNDAGVHKRSVMTAKQSDAGVREPAVKTTKHSDAIVRKRDVMTTKQNDARVRKRDVRASKQNGARAREHGVKTTKKRKRPFPFLRLPGEIRNKIYRLMAWDFYDGFFPKLHDQPAITRVSRQLRAEALPIYFENPIRLGLESSKIPCHWFKSFREVIALYGGRSGSPASGTLRHVTGVHLSFTATGKAWNRYRDLYISVDMLSDPKEMMKRQRCGFNGLRPVAIGKPDMDWTDAAAVRAACNDAATRLEDQLRRIDPGRMDHGEIPHITANQRAALDIVCIFASVCPWITKLACIGDFSRTYHR